MRPPTAVTTPTIYYIRHGLTDWNREGRLQGRRDTPLNRQGRAQSVVCADILRDLLRRDGRAPLDLGYVSSPLVRATETMDIVRATLELAPGGYALEPRLAEISFGEWEGLTYDEVLKRDSDVVARREGSKWRFQPPRGESYVEVAARVSAWHDTLTRDTVVCAHGGTGRALVAVRGVAPPEQAAHHPIEQAVVYVFEGNRVSLYG
jgi:broad specificity phosphatase PhoE